MKQVTAEIISENAFRLNKNTTQKGVKKRVPCHKPLANGGRSLLWVRTVHDALNANTIGGLGDVEHPTARQHWSAYQRMHPELSTHETVHNYELDFPNFRRHE